MVESLEGGERGKNVVKMDLMSLIIYFNGDSRYFHRDGLLVDGCRRRGRCSDSSSVAELSTSGLRRRTVVKSDPIPISLLKAPEWV
jgi:hypothetical protein